MNLIEKIKEFLFGKKEKKFYRYKSKPISPKKYNTGPVESGKTSKKLKKSKQAPRLVQPERLPGYPLVGKEAITHTSEFKKIFNDKQSDMLHKELLRTFDFGGLTGRVVPFNGYSKVVPFEFNLRSSKPEHKQEVIDKLVPIIRAPYMYVKNLSLKAVTGRKAFLESYYGKSFPEDLESWEIDDAYSKLLANFYVESELDKLRRLGYPVD